MTATDLVWAAALLLILAAFSVLFLLAASALNLTRREK